MDLGRYRAALVSGIENTEITEGYVTGNKFVFPFFIRRCFLQTANLYNSHLEKLNSENWKHSLISLYFNITLSYNELINANNKSHALYLTILDIADQIKANKGINEDLIGEYYIGIFDLCSQYENIYAMLAKDMETVKTELFRTFQVK